MRTTLQRLLVIGAATACGAGCLGVPSPRVQVGAIRDEAAASKAPRAVVEVVFHRGLAWILGGDGALVSVEPGQGIASAHFSGQRVVGMHRTLDDRLWVLSEAGGDVRVWERVDGGFAPIVQMGAPSSRVLSLSGWHGRPAILAERAIFVAGEWGGLRSTRLDEEVHPGRVRHVAFAVADDGTAYAGTNDGEWGGALFRILPSSGEVTPIRRVDGPELCAGPLNPRCDPVTTLIPDPDAPSCVLAGIGLRHFVDSGRLLRVCGTAVTVVPTPATEAPGRAPSGVALGLGAFFGYDDVELPSSAKRWRHATPAAEKGPELGGICTIDPHACRMIEPKEDPRSPAVFSLSRTKRGFWMATGDALYTVRAGVWTEVDPPALKKQGGVYLGWAPGVIAVASGANRAASVSGYTPIVGPTSLDGPEGAEDLARFPGLRSLLSGPPAGPCWSVEDHGVDAPRRDHVLCLAPDQLFARDPAAWVRAPIQWARGPDGTWTAGLSADEALRIRFTGETATMTYVAPGRRHRVWLRLVTGAALATLQDAIAHLPESPPAGARGR